MAKFLISISLVLALFASIVPFFSVGYAQVDCTSNNTGSQSNYNYQSTGQNCPPTFDEISNVAVAVISAILAIAVVVFFIMIVVNGFNFITAAGNPEKLEAGRKGLIFTIIGFGLVFGAFAILNIIKTVTGVSAGFTIDSSGNLHFNIESTFIATPPSNGS